MEEEVKTITLTEAAVEAIYREKEKIPEHANSHVLFTLTLGAKGSEHGIDYNIGLVKDGSYDSEDYEIIQQAGLTILVKKEHSKLVKGTVVSWHMEQNKWWNSGPPRQGFTFDNPILKNTEFVKSCKGCGDANDFDGRVINR